MVVGFWAGISAGGAEWGTQVGTGVAVAEEGYHTILFRPLELSFNRCWFLGYLT